MTFAPEVLFEDNHILAVNKPCGILTQSDFSGEPSLQDLLKEYIKEKYSKPGNVFLGIVHRLDRETSGVIVFARTSKAASRLSEQIRDKKTEKKYIAVVKNSPSLAKEEWTLLETDLFKNRGKTIVGIGHHKIKSSMMYKVMAESDKFMLISIRLITGKKHQIRTVFASKGAPIVGDEKYGSVERTDQGILLHSSTMSFDHPTKKMKIEIKAEPPETFQKYFALDIIKKAI